MKVVAYHGSSRPIRRFSRRYVADGFWFSESKDKVLRGESGAAARDYLIKVELRVDKVAGWDEYDRYRLDELARDGYDSVELDGDWLVFDPARVRVVSARCADVLE